jgi:hypothetical protein
MQLLRGCLVLLVLLPAGFVLGAQTPADASTICVEPLTVRAAGQSVTTPAICVPGP